jgi:hypothetical protein
MIAGGPKEVRSPQVLREGVHGVGSVRGSAQRGQADKEAVVCLHLRSGNHRRAV